jgi:hypothetical protein
MIRRPPAFTPVDQERGCGLRIGCYGNVIPPMTLKPGKKLLRCAFLVLAFGAIDYNFKFFHLAISRS